MHILNTGKECARDKLCLLPAMYTALTEFTRKQTYIVSLPVLSMCMYPFRYHYGPFRYLFGPFRCLFGPFRCLFSVPFSPFQGLRLPNI